MKCKELSEANKKMKELKYKFRFYQIGIENAKYNLQSYFDPYDYPDLDEWTWQINVQCEIASISYILKNLEKEIRELRKDIKNMNRQQNIKNNV